jgi:hypothetical protein
MESVDRFLAKYVFGFIAIEIMRLGISKYSVYNHGWLIALIAIVYSITKSTQPSIFYWALVCLVLVHTVANLVRVAMAADAPTNPSPMLWRMLWVVILLVDAGRMTIEGWVAFEIDDWATSISILVAEYALLIDRIPPRKSKENKRKLAARTA